MTNLFLLIFFFSTSFVFAAGIPSPAELRTAERYHAVGYQYQAQGNLLQARFLYQQAEAFAPDDPALLNDLGVVYESLGQADESLKHYLKAIAVDFKYLPAYMNLGHFSEARGNVATATYYFSQRVKFGDPRDSRTLQAQAQIDRLNHSSLSLAQSNFEFDMRSLESEMALRDREKDLEQERQRVIRAEEDYLTGKKLFQAGRYDEAKLSFEVSLSENKAHQGAQEMLERVNTMIALDPRVKDFGLHQDPARDMAMIEYNKGSRLMRSGNRDEALEAFDRAQELAPADPYIRAVRAEAARQP